jgi:hypothetical protein
MATRAERLVHLVFGAILRDVGVPRHLALLALAFSMAEVGHIQMSHG